MKNQIGTPFFYKLLALSAVLGAFLTVLGKFESCHPDTLKSRQIVLI